MYSLQTKYLNNIYRLRYLFILAGSALTLMTQSDLNNLESGQVDRIHLFWILVLIYRSGGYWPTVFFPLFITVVVLAIIEQRVEKLSASEPDHALEEKSRPGA